MNDSQDNEEVGSHNLKRRRVGSHNVPSNSVVMGLGQGHGTGRDGTVQDIFLIFLCSDIFGTFLLKL